VAELLGGLGLPYVEEPVGKERVGLGDWTLRSAAEACLAVLLHVQQSSHQGASVVYRPRDSMEMWKKAHPVKFLTQVVFLLVSPRGYSAKAMH
jgi:hypothetical protein